MGVRLFEEGGAGAKWGEQGGARPRGRQVLMVPRRFELMSPSAGPPGALRPPRPHRGLGSGAEGAWQG